MPCVFRLDDVLGHHRHGCLGAGLAKAPPITAALDSVVMAIGAQISKRVFFKASTHLRWLGPASILLLAGCVSPKQIEKTKSDASNYVQQQRARDIRERCMNDGAMPGTPAYLECRLRLERAAP